jgi:ankyrin repeat protein
MISSSLKNVSTPSSTSTIRQMPHNLEFRQLASKGDCDVLRKFYLGNKDLIDVNQQGPDSGKTALHQAAQRGLFEICKFLLEECDANSSLFIVDKKGLTPPQLAQNFKHYDLAKYLSNPKKVEINIGLFDSQNPLDIKILNEIIDDEIVSSEEKNKHLNLTHLKMEDWLKKLCK